MTRVLTIYLAGAVMVMTAMGGSAIIALRGGALSRAADDLASVAVIAAPMLAGAPEATLIADADGVTVGLYGADGALLAGTLDAPRSASTLPAVGSSGAASGYRRASGFDGARLYAVVAVESARPGAPGLLYIEREAPALPAGGAAAVIVWAGCGVVVVGMAVVLRRLLSRIEGSILAIRRTARTCATGKLDVEIPTDGPKEIRALGADFRAMVGELRARIDAVENQRNRLEAVLSSMVEGVIVLSRERVIIQMNPAAERLFRVQAPGGEGQTVVHCLRNAQIDRIAEEALQAASPIERTVTIYRERPIHLQVHATRLSAGADLPPNGVLLVMNDITRLQQLETIRREFVANVSHELKTPITSIKGFVETLRDGAMDDRAQAERFLEITLKHANRLNLIIEDLLSLSRLEQSEQRIAVQPSELGDVLAAVLEACRRQAREKSIEVGTHLNGAPTAMVNSHLLEQAIVNLLDNAIRYSAAGTQVDVNVENSGGTLTISVQDRGQGIGPKDLPRIFERFYRTDRARSRELGGTGLGLAIVKHIAIAHGGEVSVESELGRGSTFTVTIPQPGPQERQERLGNSF